MIPQKLDLRFGVIATMILLAALSRLIPHPHNFSPIGGMALFGAAYFTKRYFQNTVFGDLFYSAVMFGAVELSVRKVPRLAVN